MYAFFYKKKTKTNVLLPHCILPKWYCFVCTSCLLWIFPYRISGPKSVQCLLPPDRWILNQASSLWGQLIRSMLRSKVTEQEDEHKRRNGYDSQGFCTSVLKMCVNLLHFFFKLKMLWPNVTKCQAWGL